MRRVGLLLIFCFCAACTSRQDLGHLRDGSLGSDSGDPASDMNTSAARYEGFGAVTNGGAGGAVVHVTNLNATGPGSLHDAIGSNRTVVFDVGGTINGFRYDSSSGDAVVTNLTIDALTAPSPGITLDNGNNGNALSFQDGCHDIIVRGIRVRNAGQDGFSIAAFGDDPPYNIIIDRCSSSGSRDGNIDIVLGAHDITVQYSIFGGGSPVASAYPGTMLIAYGAYNVSVHHNFFSPRTVNGVGEGCPSVLDPDRTTPSPMLVTDFRNNVVWKWGRDNGTGSGSGTTIAYHTTANVIGNYYYSEQSPDNATNTDNGFGDGATGLAFMSDNLSGNSGVDANAPSNHALWSIPAAAMVTTEQVCTAAERVLDMSGPRPLDAADQALVDDVNLPGCR